jgi:hypothetical protein
MERGRPRKINSPEELLELFNGYLDWVKENPVRKMVFVGRDGNKEYELVDRPLSIDGFEVYCYTKDITVEHYLNNKNGSYEDFCSISTRIKRIIRENQISGGMAGLYNASLTARINGLAEKQETKIEGEVAIFKGIDLDVSKNDSTS